MSTITLPAKNTAWERMETIQRKLELFSKFPYPVLVQQAWTERLHATFKFISVNYGSR